MGKTVRSELRTKGENWIGPVPSWWKKMIRKRDRNLARSDMQKQREPQPRYGDLYYW